MFHKRVAILLLLLSASAALADHNNQHSCPSVEVFCRTQNNVATKKQLRELETRLNETVADAITTSQDAFYRSAYGQLFDELNSTVQSELFPRLETALYDRLFRDLFEAILNASMSNDTELPTSPPDSICCGEREAMTRIAYLDMTDPFHSCPPAWREVTSPKRTCARGTDRPGCDSAVFSANGYRYSRVCGRIRAYQCGTPNAFDSGSSLINDHYIDGVSITHSDPRQHVWSFAAGYFESNSGGSACPCSSLYSGDHVPSFLGSDYFCDTGADTLPPVCNLNTGAGFFPDDPLWDGEGCAPTSTCCEFNNPPWFCKTLPQPTTDDLEVRLCSNGITGGREDTPIELIEIYVN